MAKVFYTSSIGAVRGEVDGWIFRRFFGRHVVSPKPDRRKRVRTGAEAATVTRFQRAAQAARRAPPEMIARYDERARAENKSKFSIRTRDYMVPPWFTAVYVAGYFG